MATDPTGYRRQQRRRAIIAWATAAFAVVLVALGVVFGGDDHEEEFRFVSPGYAISADQYAGLETGLDEGEFLDRLGQSGLTEGETSDDYVALFPPHEDDVTCSYWEISDRLGQVARICFDDEGQLVQKLERGVGEEPTGVSA